MRRVRRCAAAFVLLLVPTGCGDAPEPSAPLSAPLSAPPSYGLPFGLVQVEGTSARGRPAVYDDVLLEFQGVPVEVTRLRAAYAVTSDDPVGVFRAWVEQLATLPLPELSLAPGLALDSGQWLQAGAFDAPAAGAPPAGSAGLQLWTTADDPVLLVDVALVDGADGPTPAAVPAVEPPPRPEARVGDPDAEEGDVLFTEQGDQVRLPDGTRALIPTLPTPEGTGGSASVLSAEDGEAAVRAVLDQARAQSDTGDLTGPTVGERDGVQVVTGSWVVPAGGWGFDVVAVRGPEDATATVHVRSAAD